MSARINLHNLSWKDDILGVWVSRDKTHDWGTTRKDPLADGTKPLAFEANNPRATHSDVEGNARGAVGGEAKKR